MESRGEMMQPHKCPVCEGRGNVPSGFYDPPTMTHEYCPTSTTPITETCKSCNGQGILWDWNYSPTPDPTPWVCPGDRNTTYPPFEITWSSANIESNQEDETIFTNYFYTPDAFENNGEALCRAVDFAHILGVYMS